MALIQTNMPNAVINHHSQELSADAKSVEFLTIKVHLARDRPKPDNAPYLQKSISLSTYLLFVEITSVKFTTKKTLTKLALEEEKFIYLAAIV